MYDLFTTDTEGLTARFIQKLQRTHKL